ncbi:hypothetical protein Tco_0467877 [Tanacetum coccineum]
MTDFNSYFLNWKLMVLKYQQKDANHKFLRSLCLSMLLQSFTSSTNNPEKEVLAGFADEVIYSLFSKQSEDWDLLHEDLEQIDDVDIEEQWTIKFGK